MPVSRRQKIQRLEKNLEGLGPSVVAFSGGVDSSFLLAVCCRVLKGRILAVTALSQTYTPAEARCAEKTAKALGARHVFISTREWDDRHFRANPKDRCYYCKKELFGCLKMVAGTQGFGCILDGSNADDLRDYRPGAKAKAEAGVRSPLQEAGLTKEDIREASRELGLESWNKPAMPCLASRVPYGSAITKKRLLRIGKAEALVKDAFGIRGNLRVRDFWPLARIEADRKELTLLKKSESRLREMLGPLGYKNIRIEGYRMGNLNTPLVETRSRPK